MLFFVFFMHFVCLLTKIDKLRLRIYNRIPMFFIIMKHPEGGKDESKRENVKRFTL